MPGYALHRALLAICLALAGTGFASPAPASAELFADWDVGGAAIETGLEPSVAGKAGETGLSILTKVGTSSVQITCASLSLSNMHIQVFGSVRSGAKMTLQGCKTFLNKAESARCQPLLGLLGGKVDNGLIVSNELTGLLQLHEEFLGSRQGLLVLEAAGAIPPPVMVIYFGKLCAIGEEFAVTGKLTLRDSDAELEVPKITHSFSEGPLSSLLFGSNSMTIDGSMLLTLAGAHEKMSWNGLVN